MDFSPANTDIKPTVCGTKNYNEVNDLCEFFVLLDIATGLARLLLFVRVLLDLASLLNISLDPHVDLTIFDIGGLILLKGMTAKRIYKNWPLDIMETATCIYFNMSWLLSQSSYGIIVI